MFQREKLYPYTDITIDIASLLHEYLSSYSLLYLSFVTR